MHRARKRGGVGEPNTTTGGAVRFRSTTSDTTAEPRWDAGLHPVSNLLEGFWLTPSRDVARVWGECRFASHGLARTSVPMAPTPSTLGELLAVLGVKNSKNTKSLWHEGSAAKLPLVLPSLSRGCRRLKAYLRRRLR